MSIFEPTVDGGWSPGSAVVLCFSGFSESVQVQIHKLHGSVKDQCILDCLVDDLRQFHSLGSAKTQLLTTLLAPRRVFLLLLKSVGRVFARQKPPRAPDASSRGRVQARTRGRGLDSDLRSLPDRSCASGRRPSDPSGLMGQVLDTQSSVTHKLRVSFKAAPPTDHDAPPPKSIFATLRKPRASKPSDFVPLFNDCVSVASSRTQEYLLFTDPEDKFRPRPEVLTQIFLMTYISQSVHLNMMDTFNCTVLTPGQRVLLGADWVWALLDKPTKNPRIQIAVQVLHLPEREGVDVDKPPPEAYSESVQMAHVEAGDKNTSEKLVEFCSSIGKDCYALFLFMGRKNDRENIYGVVSNNFEAATGKCHKIDRAFIENFFKGSRYLHTPTGMMQAIITKKEGDPLTLMVKFS